MAAHVSDRMRKMLQGGADKAKAVGMLYTNQYMADSYQIAGGKGEGEGDKQDAARHMLAVGNFSRTMGPTMAKLLGIAHEVGGVVGSIATGKGLNLESAQMDIHNNNVAAEKFKDAKNYGEIKRGVLEMLQKVQYKDLSDKKKPVIVKRD